MGSEKGFFSARAAGNRTLGERWRPGARADLDGASAILVGASGSKARPGAAPITPSAPNPLVVSSAGAETTPRGLGVSARGPPTYTPLSRPARGARTTLPVPSSI